LLVQLPLVLADRVAPIVIIRAGTFTAEIMEQIRLINPATEFIQ